MPRHSDSSAPEKTRRRRGGATTLNKSSYSARMLACPFTKFDKQLYRSCRFMTFRQNADLRVHFKRCHLQPPFCSICKQTFDGADGRKLLQAHLQQRPASCQPSYDDSDPPGITPEQCDMMGLSKQRESRSVTPEERVQGWYNMWDILFPGNARPASIYHENSELSERVAESRETFFGGGAVTRRIEALLHDENTRSFLPGGGGFGDSSSVRDFVYHCVTVIFDDFESHLVHHGGGGRATSATPQTSNRSPPTGRRSRSEVIAATGGMYPSAGYATAGVAPSGYLDPHSGAAASPFSGASSYLSEPHQQVFGWASPSAHGTVTPAASVTEHDAGLESLSLDHVPGAPGSFGWMVTEAEQQATRSYSVGGSFTGGIPYHTYAYPGEHVEDEYE
ncbi:hypothetical protein QBC38DRAFT_547716 [Podospora fimiseda]|uniref:C2H2-type domain-containing protein n=1 Tax=Podospora fimiseda TaxID=252190 RepID=A0AAN7BJG6_9PEZI|nr:hypothetical protein QBC38DRAFT_547716 [Podospora fimiseda]